MIRKIIVISTVLIAVSITALAISKGFFAPAQSNSEVIVTNFKFEPKKLTVTEGTTVTWVNKEGTHTVTEDSNAFVSKTLKPGDNFTYQFNKVGTFPYHCALHGGRGGSEMAGTITVIKKK